MSQPDRKPPSPSPSQRSQSSVSSSGYTYNPKRILAAARETSVSIFTGLPSKDVPPSPSAFARAENVSSPGAIDRVFPIRSAVSIDATVTPMSRDDPGDAYAGMVLGAEGTLAARRSHASNNRRGSSASSDTTKISASPEAKRQSIGVPVKSENGPSPDIPRRSSVKSDQIFCKNKPAALSQILVNGDAESIKSGRSSISAGGASRGSKPASVKDSAESTLVTARFKHVITDGGHAVITGRDGETLQRCEDEPIHIPGAVQSFGLLLEFREEYGKLVVHVVSENSASIIGYSPQQLFKLDNFLDIFTEEQADNLLDHLDFIRDEQASDVVSNGPEVFMVSVRPPQHRTRKLWCAMHACPSDPESVICEFEIEDDAVNPLVPDSELTPEPPEDTLGSDPTAEELAESTVNISKPLRILRSARKKRGEAAAMEVFNIMSQVQEQLANAPSLPVFLKVLIGVVKELTGFHRVMVYQFDHSWNGRVVAELVDPRATKDLYKGLNFPASDIPKQARDMYKLNKVRLLYDRDQETARLVCKTMEDLEKPLDLTHAYLRAMSPIHIKYLANMAVRSSMSISINAFDKLWGLIALHSYGSKGMRVSFPIRKMCRLVGDTASRNIERLSYASRLQARKLINTASSSKNPSGYIVASSEDLLRLFDADVGALSICEETKVMGNPDAHLQEVLAMVEFLRLKKLGSVTTSQDIAADFPDLRYSPGMKSLAGLLYVPLATGGEDFIAFFRLGVLQEVKWAGNPYEKFVKEGTEGYLEPRKSFKQWSEVIVGRCRDWSEEEVETASVLCLVYGKFIDVWRQKEAALQNSQLTRLLLANSAHEVRTPLNAIINYLEIALEGSLDQETRDNLAKSHSASKSLVYVINDLLDLTKTEENQHLVKDELFDLHNTLKEATDPFVGDAKRKNIAYSVSIDAGIPQKVSGDHRRVRQIVSNLIANAIQHTAEGEVKVEAWNLIEQSTLERCEIEISVEDTGIGMAQNKVDALFRELEEVSYEPGLTAQALLDPQPSDNNGVDTKNTLGLGLAVVARTIRNMNGQLRLKTEGGKGSKFIILLGFDVLRASSSDAGQGRVSTGTATPTHSIHSRASVHENGEVTLVKRLPSTPSRGGSIITRKQSGESMKSLTGSMKSGASAHSNRSDADRLIDAIQEPLRLNESVNPQSLARPKALRSLSAGVREGVDIEPQQKSRSLGSSKDMQSAMNNIPGQQNITDSRTPLRPVRIPEFERSATARPKASKVKFEEAHSLQFPRVQTPTEIGSVGDITKNFSVLVAEDDPINSRIMKKRLEKLGHKAHLTVNGEECSSAYGEQATTFDAVLMDLQMPIVDGFSSTKMIRSFEKTQAGACLSDRARMNGRIPVFAVSASLLEKEKDKYIATGFDGWILKPVDFKRVDELLRGIVDDDVRNGCLYQAGKWEQGGWFEERHERDNAAFDVDTKPSDKKPTAESAGVRAASDNTNPSDGSLTPTLQTLHSTPDGDESVFD